MIRSLFLLCLSLLALPGLASASGADDLAAGFASPPDSARPTTFWHWIDGNVSKEGITADLEDMKRRGIGGVLLVCVHNRMPPGPVIYESKEWFDLVQFAIQEAHRLGLTMELAPGEGWAAGGGKWIDPAHSMLKVTTSEVTVKGPSHYADVLPQPDSLMKFYKDVKVLAFPTPPADLVRMAQSSPVVTSSDAAFDPAKVLDGDPQTTAVLPLPAAGKPQYVQFAFAQPYLVRSVGITAGDKGLYLAEAQLQYSNDGQKFSNLRSFKLDSGNFPQSRGVKPTSARFYRVVFTKPPQSLNGNPPAPNLTFAEIGLQPSLVIDGLDQKLDLIRHIGTPSAQPSATAPQLDLAVDPAKVTDLSAKMDASGRLTWDVPEGNWVILRVGYTTTGSANNPAEPAAKGLESDKLSAEATDLLWSGMTQKVLDLAGPLAGQTVVGSWVDSWEAGSQNWTPAMMDEFQRRRGYDMTPYLPVFAGHVVDSPAKTERFLWDLRRTIADLCDENFFGHLADLAHKHGMKFTTEPYGTGPFDDLADGAKADVLRGEFWPSRTFDYQESPKVEAGVAHVYGIRTIGMESFTDIEGRWQNSPDKLKSLGDLVYTLGANHFTLHEYAHQPWLSVVPGMTLSQFGSNFNRGVTWGPRSTAWMQYLARCQFLLQQGLSVTDFLYYNGDTVPNLGVPLPLVMGRRGDDMAPPAGYDYDDCSEDAILNRVSVKDGRLVLPDGMSYRALVLPGDNPMNSHTMTPQLLRKLKELADAGAVIVGGKPVEAPGLTDFPQSDDEVKKLVAELWGGGKITEPKSMSDVVSQLGLKPDFEFADKTARLLYAHRTVDGTEIYFLSNQDGGNVDTDCTFRVQDKVPELWWPDSGKIEPVAVYAEENGRTRIPMHFQPNGSVFVVFRAKGPAPADHAVSLTRLDPPVPKASTLQITKATYGTPGRGSNDVTEVVASYVRNGGLSLRVDPELFGRDPAQRQEKQLDIAYTYNGAPGTSTTLERDRVTLGDATATIQFPDAKLAVQPDQSLKLEAWQAGSYAIKTASGKDLKVTAPALPDAVTVTGPWELAFPPNWGAPDKVTLDKLISWSDSPQDGVKYFSGTATYHKTLNIPPGLLGPDRHLYLDLGDVKVLAEVSLNGKDLGILWKYPYCVEVTDAAKAGDNELLIQVTNLWPNRLIGDEHLPNDRTWSGSGLKEWPGWLEQGKPSPTGRFTFETWHQWLGGDKLWPSGLLGPVTLIPSLDVKVAP